MKVVVCFYDAHLKRRREAIWTEPDPAVTSGFLGPLVEDTPSGPVFVRRVALNEVLYLMIDEG